MPVPLPKKSLYKAPGVPHQGSDIHFQHDENVGIEYYGDSIRAENSKANFSIGNR